MKNLKYWENRLKRERKKAERDYVFIRNNVSEDNRGKFSRNIMCIEDFHEDLVRDLERVREFEIESSNRMIEFLKHYENFRKTADLLDEQKRTLQNALKYKSIYNEK